MTATLDLANRKRIETFKTIVADLKAGKQHSITRLTTIKSLCKDPAVASAFTKYLASLATETLAPAQVSCPWSSGRLFDASRLRA